MYRLIRFAIKAVLYPFAWVMTRTALRDLFAHKEWLRKNIPHNFLGQLYHSVLTKLYFNRMEAAGSMIGVNANFLTPPRFTSWDVGNLHIFSFKNR